MQHYGELSKTVTTTGAYNTVTVVAKGDQCNGAPQFTVKINGTTVGTRSATSPVSGKWDAAAAVFKIAHNVPAGTQNIVVSYDNDGEWAACNRNLHLDRVTLEN